MKYLKLLIILFFTFILQGVIWNNFAGREFFPDFLLIVVIIFQQRLGWMEGIAFGLSAGVVADIFSSGEIGIYSLVYLIASFIMQSVRGYLEIENIVFQTGYLILFTFSVVTANLFYSGYVLALDRVTIVFIANAFAIQLFLNLIAFFIIRWMIPISLLYKDRTTGTILQGRG